MSLLVNDANQEDELLLQSMLQQLSLVSNNLAQLFERFQNPH